MKRSLGHLISIAFATSLSVAPVLAATEPIEPSSTGQLVLSDSELHRLLHASEATVGAITIHKGERVAVLARSLGWLDAHTNILRLTNASDTSTTADLTCRFEQRPSTPLARLVTVSGSFEPQQAYLGVVSLDNCTIDSFLSNRKAANDAGSLHDDPDR